MMKDRTARLEPLGRPLVRLALVVVIGGVAPLLDTTIVNVALHALGAQFHSPATSVQWVVTAYLLALGITIPLTTWATARFGAKRLWVAGLVVFLIGSGLSGLAWNLGGLIAFRALQGMGAGIIQPVLQTILVRAAGPAKTGRVLTIVTSVSLIAPVAGPLVGGLIVTDASWRWVFAVNIPLCLVAILLAARVVPGEKSNRQAGLDVPGFLLIAAGTVALLFALGNATSNRADAVGTFYLPLGAGLVLIAGFITWSLCRGGRALIPLRMFTDRTFAGASGALFFSGLSLYGGLFLIPLYFQAERGLGALASGTILALQGIGSLLTRWVGGIVDRVGARTIIVTGIAICAAATIPFALAGPHTSYLLLAATLVVRGGALSAANIAITAGAFSRLSRAKVPAGSAVIRLLQQLGGSAGTALLAALLTAGFGAAFTWSIALTALAIIPALLMPGTGAPKDDHARHNSRDAEFSG
ncbi:MFS transporter [Actinoplanes sp. ATCC 53533]|uniref:DHA2 family efflux MFS transporter permease subunit n=1 Tax=Actinoplanes sp. ATCC 53533 TaxID=1288362 RepID=UPI000F782D8F|nr:DHA2 family efflux MFS transporter permease subunit [Actinoplanes sp. ATCC 53533]RSM74886.1 MFS transporter [Actinoplanes sp. ATCC 53533]